jgi:tRNA A37 threonylcarbamoyladenosine dehydratase
VQEVKWKPKVKVTDITNTVNCCKTIRRRLKEVKIDKLKVVFSSIQDESSLRMTDGSNFKKSFYGTNSYMPGLFGLYAAETVIRYLPNSILCLVKNRVI